IAGDNGLVLYTNDGGFSWDIQQTPVSSALHKIYFESDGLHGIAAGNFGHIIRTVNGGAAWTRESTITGDTLYGISMTSFGLGGES
ncbi:hypothetical protein Q6325_28375, partial [Klebsiella pneumoniae]|uniref:hypothetical protein n=1 Tax=Klebsiella pneumoniae TaxID=573 RepID=UPI002744C10E|nr:hypothetical protein [Klebsiella pneumoniae]